LVAREHRDAAAIDLAFQGLKRAEEKLLPGLTASIKGASHLHAAKRAILQQPSILAGQGNTLGHGLIDDVHRQLRKAIDIPLASAIVAALHRVIEEPIDAVAVVLIVLRRVDPALCGNGMRAPRRVVEHETLDVVSEL